MNPTTSSIIKKELLSVFRLDYISKFKQAISLIINLVLNLLVVFFIAYLYILIDGKISNIVGASKSVFILFVEVILFIYTLIATNNTAKVLYNTSDKYIIRVMPLKDTEIILPKLLALYCKTLFSYGIMFITILFTYGIINSQGVWYYILSLLFLFTTPVIMLFIATALSYPFYLLKNFINRHSVVQIIVMVLFISLFSLVYFGIVQLFIELIANQNVIIIFNADNMNLLSNICFYLIPSNLIVSNILLEPSKFYITYHILLFIFSGCLIYYIANVYYHKYLIHDEKFKVASYRKLGIEKHPIIKKDIKLIFRNSSSGVSFVIVSLCACLYCTFLAYLVNQLFDIYGLNYISNSIGFAGFIKYTYFPIIALLISLLLSLVFAGESQLFKREENTKSILLTIPINIKNQVLSKMTVNLVLLFIVNFLIYILILSFGILPFVEGSLLFLITLSSSFATYFLSSGSSMAISKEEAKRGNITPKNVSFVYSLFIPLVSFIISIFALYLFFNVNLINSISTNLIYLFVALINISLLVLTIFYFMSRLKKYSTFISNGGGYNFK